MANISCTSCEEIRQEAPSLIVNGLDDNMCASLQNDTGLVASKGHDDCTDLNNLNDCLVGNEADEVDMYDVCDWKTFMKQFIPNLWTTLKAMICAICGLWTNLHSLTSRIDCLNSKIVSVTIEPSVKAFRCGTQVAYSSIATEGLKQSMEIYEDAADNSTENSKERGAKYGSTPATKDYVAILTWCATAQQMSGTRTGVTCAVRNNRQSEGYAELRSQHYSVTGVNMLSINQTAVCYMPKGTHLILTATNNHEVSGAEFRIHQVSMILIPIIAGEGSDVQC